MEKKNNAWKIILGVTLGIILIGVITFIMYTFIKKDPIKVYESAINSLYSKLDNNLENAGNIKNLIPPTEQLKINSQFKVNSNIEGLEEYNDLEFNYNAYIDYQKNKSLIELAINRKEENLIKALLAVLDDKTYFKSDELFDKTLLLGENNIIDNKDLIEVNKNDIDIEEVRKTLKSLKNILIDSLDKNYFKVTNEIIEINGKDYNTKKYTYILNDDNQRRTIDFIMNSILNDYEILELFSNLSGKTIEEIETILTSYLDDVENNNDELETLNISLYLKNNNIISAEMEKNGTLFIYNSVDEMFEIILKAQSAEMKIYNDTDDIKFYMKQSGIEILNGYINYTEDEFKINITVVSEGIPINLFLTLKNVSEDPNETSINASLGMDMNVFGNSFNFIIDGNYKVVPTDEDLTVDVTDAVDINNLNNEELKSISTKFNEILSKIFMSGYLD